MREFKEQRILNTLYITYYLCASWVDDNTVTQRAALSDVSSILPSLLSLSKANSAIAFIPVLFASEFASRK